MSDILNLSEPTLHLVARWLENGSEPTGDHLFLAQRADVSIKQARDTRSIPFPMSDEEADTLLHEILTRRDEVETFIDEGFDVDEYKDERDLLVDDYYGIRDFLGLDD